MEINSIAAYRILGWLLMLGCGVAAVPPGEAVFAGGGFAAGAIFVATSSILAALQPASEPQ